MENTKSSEPKKSSLIDNLGNLGMKVCKSITEWFTGKPLSEEEKVHRARKREHLKQLREIQEEAQYRRDIELAKRGEYIPPESPKKTKKDDGLEIFKNLGKHNPLEDFERKSSLGSKSFGVESYGGIRAINSNDLKIPGYVKNPLGERRR